MPNIIVFDVSNLVHRVYHATAASTPEDRLLPFARSRLKKSVTAMLREVEPLRFVAAFDCEDECFRKALIPGEYKAHRGEKPALLTRLLAEAPEIFAELGAECLVADSHEADDVLASVADQCLAVGGWRTLLLTNDADALSCVYDAGGGEGVFALRNKDGTYHLWGPKEVEASPKFGVPPSRLSLFKSLAGDQTDGYGGIPQIGPVGAKRLANTYSSMRRIYAALGDPRAFTRAERAKLENFGLERALVMERVARLVRNAPLRRLG